MFRLIFQTIILIYIIILIYSVIDIQKYNINGILVEIKEIHNLTNELVNLNPLIMKYNHTLSCKNLPENYIMHDRIININELYNKSDKQILINKEKEIINYQNQSYEQYLPNYNILYPFNFSTSIYKDDIQLPLKQCIHNYNIIGTLDGDSTLYLFNPKHKNEILHKENNEIKKWGHKIKFEKDTVLFIPPNWYYIQEIPGKCIQYHIDIDTYFTFIPMFFKSYK